MTAGKKYVAKVGKRNQLTIPAELLRELGIGPGDSVEIVSADGTVTIEPCSKTPFQDAIGLLRPGTPLSNEDIVQLVKEARKERARHAAEDDARIVREALERD